MAALIFFSVLGYSSFAQQKPLPTADNSIHDRMYTLIQKSDKVVLPDDVTQHITAINTNTLNKEKIMYAQLTVLKVLHNKALSKEDISFFGSQLLKRTSGMYVPIQADIKKILDNL